MLELVQIVTLVALAVWTLATTSRPAQDVARIVTGIGAAVWAVLLLLPAIG